MNLAPAVIRVSVARVWAEDQRLLRGNALQHDLGGVRQRKRCATNDKYHAKNQISHIINFV